jgi:hypothetical protein
VEEEHGAGVMLGGGGAGVESVESPEGNNLRLPRVAAQRRFRLLIPSLSIRCTLNPSIKDVVNLEFERSFMSKRRRAC